MRKQSNKPAKPAKASAPAAAAPVAAKPAVPAAAEARAARVAVINAHRATVAQTYNGPSLAARGSVRGGKLARYIERVQTPGHRADTASTRDESLLRLIGANADKAGAFDPCALNADLGVISRLGSLGFITVAGDGLALTQAGRERANLLQRKAG